MASKRKRNDGTRRVNNAAPATTGVLKPLWKDLCQRGSVGKFKPVIDRKQYEDEKTRPKFHLPCKETRDISPGSFARLFLSDDIIEEIAKNSEAYRLRHAVKI